MLAAASDREVFVPNGDKQRKKSTVIAHALAIELMHYGIKSGPAILERISRHRRSVAQSLAVSILKLYTIGDLNPPLFEGFQKE